MRIDLLEAFGLDPNVIAILKEKYGAELLPIQERAFKEYQILNGGNFLISAVTSSGKTLVGEILALHYGSKGKRVFYLVPTKALAEEKFEQFREDYEKAGIQTVISTHDRREYDERIEGRRFHIAIIVYEKLHSLLVGNPKLLGDIGLVLVDELQYLTDEERGPVLEILLTRILLNPKQSQLVGLSAVLGQSESLAQWLRAKMIREDKRPVELRQGVFFDGKFHYREFNSGIEGEENWFPLKSEREAGQYVETAKFLAEEKGEQTIIFLPDKPTTEALAHHLCHSLSLPPAAGAIAEMNALEESVSKDMLITFLSSGVAVHNADLSWEERDIVERYTRKGEIRVLCTTTTLAVGLNLPMKNAIVAPLRWKYFRDTRSLSKERILVSDYENMGGRVARYGFVSDFGRALFVTASYVDHKFYTDHYVKGPIEEMTPALNRREMDRHILNLVASEICRDAGEIKTFLKSTFTGRSLWNTEMTDADYDKVIEETIALSVKWGLIEKTAKDRLIPTPLGKNTAAKGIALETAVFFLEFLNNADPRNVSDFEILMLLAMSHDAIPVYIPLKRNERGQGGYLYELKQAIHDSMEETKPVFQSVWKISGMLSQEKERAVKKALMMNRWISNAETKEIENSYEVFSGAIKRVGEDFSWLAETLASLAKEIRWDQRVIVRISNLSQRLVYGVTEKGLALSQIRLRGLGRTYINRLIAEGYDTPEAVAELPVEELERLLPKHLAERLYRHFHRDYQKPEDVTDQEAMAVIRESVDIAEAGVVPVKGKAATIDSPPTAPPGDGNFPRPLADILSDKALLSILRTRLADTKDLRELITDPPVIFMEERQQFFFYRGVPIKLQPVCFSYLSLLAEKPKQIVVRDEIYRRLWPGPMKYDGSNKPYERQISDHKRRCIAQIKKGIAGKIAVETGELETLIFTRPKVGYMLNVGKEATLILPPS
ncbi:MAG TPA: DEAD/DEAH box helicase [Syntrophales bacterium]|nr:DEAD/DEAH box helicase [Syntrophales bacterium]